MIAELKDSLEFLFPDSKANRNACRSMDIDVARGGTIAVHVLLNGLKRGALIRLSVLLGKSPVRDLKCFRLRHVPVEINSGPVGFTETAESGVNRYVIRRAPFRVYDAMEPVSTKFKTDAPTMVLRLHLPVPRDVRPTERRYRIEISCGSESSKLALRARVHKVLIPSVGVKSFPYTNWFNFTTMAKRYGLKPWSEAHWRMIRRYAKLMVHGRQNTFWLPLGDIFKRTERGLILERARLRRIVKLFTATGMHYIEGGHFAGRTGGEWEAKTFSVGMKGPLVASRQGNAEIARIAQQLMEEIERNGWRERWLQHTADEPCKGNAADYRALVGMVRKYMPGLPIIDALMEVDLAGTVDIWCPQPHYYQKNRGDFEAMRATGDKIWFYTCCFPCGNWLNRLLDMELLRPTLLGWGAALFRLDGFLHWGLNHYQAGKDPFKVSVSKSDKTFHPLPAGDKYIVYPGPHGPWSSLRLEAQREGFEDYELLHLLQAHNAGAARTILKKVITGFDSYTKDLRVFRAARRALLMACSKL